MGVLLGANKAHVGYSPFMCHQSIVILWHWEIYIYSVIEYCKPTFIDQYSISLWVEKKYFALYSHHVYIWQL